MCSDRRAHGILDWGITQASLEEVTNAGDTDFDLFSSTIYLARVPVYSQLGAEVSPFV